MVNRPRLAPDRWLIVSPIVTSVNVTLIQHGVVLLPCKSRLCWQPIADRTFVLFADCPTTPCGSTLWLLSEKIPQASWLNVVVIHNCNHGNWLLSTIVIIDNYLIQQKPPLRREKWWKQILFWCKKIHFWCPLLVFIVDGHVRLVFAFKLRIRNSSMIMCLCSLDRR
jgi:hypothetical protein